MDAFTAQQTLELIARTGAKKANMKLGELFINSCMAGPLLGFGCAVLVSVNASPWYQTNAPGLIRFIGAIPFPIGLTMIVQSGADLFTSNIMYMLTALLSKRITLLPLIISWFVSFFGNLAGMLFFVTIITGYGGVFDESQEYTQAAIMIATQKAVDPKWHQIFLRGIGANWLVCFAVFGATQGRDLVSKITAIWWPTLTFVALSLDHVVANMYFIPNAIWVGAPIKVSFYIWKSLIPTLLGNMVGGGLFVATVYWYLYLTGETSVKISFDLGAEDVAIKGPAGPLRTNAKMTESLNAHSSPLPLANPSQRHLVSGIVRELGDHTSHARTVQERERENSVSMDSGERV